MFKLGRIQTLRVAKLADHGAYLAAPEETTFENLPENEIIESKNILLPKKEAGELKVNDNVAVFLYKDSEDRPIATTTVPKLQMGQVSELTVKDVNKVGAFLDWGLVKDLFLPFKEQTYRVKPGDSVLVSLYVDKSSRLCATMKIYPLLRQDSPYKTGDNVTGLCYEKIDNFGAYIAVDKMFSALIPKHRLFTQVLPGMEVKARVTKVQPDGKLELDIKDKSYVELDSDAEMIYEMLEAAGGFLPYHDKSSSEVIIAKFGISKNAYKRAIGRLFKERRIIIEENGISKAE